MNSQQMQSPQPPRRFGNSARSFSSMIFLGCLLIISFNYCNGFNINSPGRSNSAASKSVRIGGGSFVPSSAGTFHNQQMSLARAGTPQNMIQRNIGVSLTNPRDTNVVQIGSTLFPRKNSNSLRKSSISRAARLLMATSDNSDDVSGGPSDNSLVKVWMQMRKLVARIWAILFLKPLRLLKSIFTNDVGTTDVDTESNEDAEPAQEEVVLSEMENLAVVEDDVDKIAKALTEEPPKVETPPAQSDAAEAKNQVTVLTPTESTEDGVNKVVLSEGSIASVSAPESTTVPTTTTPDERQATACPTVDLTGNWTLIVDDAFKSEYDEYLRKLGQPMLVRTVALTVIGSTKEETRQMEEGKKLFIKGTNVRGSWERTLEASAATIGDGDDERIHAVEGHVLKPMTTADEEEVEVASWWEENGKVHKSWVVGGKKYGGGDFENRRYLKDNGNVLVCESVFHPNEEGREKARVTWRFLREGAIFGDSAVEFPNIFDVFGSEEEKRKKEEEVDEAPKSRLVVGDILDSVATADEAIEATEEKVIDVEEEIERESWVPPAGERWAICAPGVDLSGKWKLIITEEFKTDYDEFLKSLGQPLIIRGAAVVLIGNTREETKQSDKGRSLYIKGINAKGIWERTLISSGSDFDTTLTPNPDGSYNHLKVPIETADSEQVEAESWWEKDGTVHVSATLGVKKYGGGSFISKRYLENDGDVYVCESTFVPDDTERRENSYLKWRFLREGATLYVG